ncbi:UDP-glycosyltransferase 91C1 [Linum perenne]
MLSSLISFIKLPLSPVKNLPPNAEATSDLEVKEFGYLKRAYDLLQQPLCQYLRSTTLHHDFIVCDYTAFWLPSKAHAIRGGGVVQDAACRFRRMLRGCDLIAVRTCPELEPDWVKLLGKIYNKAVFPIGMLLREEDVGDETHHQIFMPTG